MSSRDCYLRLSAAFILFAPSWLHAQWQSLDGGLNWQVIDFEYNQDSSELIVAGGFPYTRSDSLRANGLANWNGTEWNIQGLGDGCGDTSAQGNLSINFLSVALFHDTLFAGALGSHIHYHPEWGLGAGMNLGEWFSIGDPNNYFYTLKVHDRLFSGGRTDTLYGQYMPGIKEWIGGTWQAIPNMPLGPGSYYCATYWHDQYWFAGSFISGGARSVIAFDGVDQWTPNWGPGGGWINAITGFGDSLYVGGWYPLGSDTESPMIQLWDGAAWQPFFSDVLQFHWQIFDMEVYQGALYISGDFHFLDDPSTQYSLLRFDDHELCAIGGVNTVGVNGQIAFFQGDLYMALASQFPGLEFEWIGRLPLEGLVPDRCVEVVTGVNGHEGDQILLLSPNPTWDALTLSGLDHLNDATVQVIDALGRALTPALSVGSSTLQLRTSQWPAGTYWVRLTSRSGIVTRRFLKL